MTDSWKAPTTPSVQVGSVEDAMNMLDTPRPLLPSEILMVLEGLWKTAYTQGREHGTDYGPEVEYEDPTVTIRRNLEGKLRDHRGRQ